MVKKIVFSILLVCTIATFAIGCGSSQGNPVVTTTGSGLIPGPYGFGTPQVPYNYNGYNYGGYYGNCPVGYIQTSTYYYPYYTCNIVPQFATIYSRCGGAYRYYGRYWGC